MVARHYEDKIFSLVSGIHRIVYNLRYVTQTEIVWLSPVGIVWYLEDGICRVLS